MIGAIGILRGLAAIASACFAASICGAPSIAKSSGNPTVLELFTSQGCSSCPPADKLLQKYAAQGHIIALTFNVDYWDYLGWKDTLGQASFTKRQKNYAYARGDGQVYTPQIVVNGMYHAVGSRPAEIDRAITKSNNRRSTRRIPISVEATKTDFVITIGGSNEQVSRATVWIAAVAPKVTISVKKGENGGRRLTYHNVVRHLMPVATWTGQQLNLRLRQRDVLRSGTKQSAVWVQTSNNGPILAAAWLPQ